MAAGVQQEQKEWKELRLELQVFLPEEVWEDLPHDNNSGDTGSSALSEIANDWLCLRILPFCESKTSSRYFQAPMHRCLFYRLEPDIANWMGHALTIDLQTGKEDPNKVSDLFNKIKDKTIQILKSKDKKEKSRVIRTPKKWLKQCATQVLMSMSSPTWMGDKPLLAHWKWKTQEYQELEDGDCKLDNEEWMLQFVDFCKLQSVAEWCNQQHIYTPKPLNFAVYGSEITRKAMQLEKEDRMDPADDSAEEVYATHFESEIDSMLQSKAPMILRGGVFIPLDEDEEVVCGQKRRKESSAEQQPSLKKIKS